MIIGVDIRVLGTGRMSGIEEYTEQLLAHMIPLDRGVRYRLFYSGRRPLERRPWMEASNVSVYDAGRSNRLLFLTTRLMRRPYLDRLVGGANVFFFPHFLAGATSQECRRVLTIHDLSFERFPELFSIGRRMWHCIQMRPRAQVARADRIIAVSDSTRADLVSLYDVDPARISVVHSGVDPRLCPMPGTTAGRRYILALGTLEPRKNFSALIKAFGMLGRQFADIGLVIAGPRGWLWNERVEDRVSYIGEVSRDQRHRLVAGAAMLAYPSLFEGFGFPPLEAMACGTPVLVGANSSMLGVCGDAALAVNPYSVTALRDGLAALLGDELLRERLIVRGYDLVQQFSWRRCAQETLGMLQ